MNTVIEGLTLEAAQSIQPLARVNVNEHKAFYQLWMIELRERQRQLCETPTPHSFKAAVMLSRSGLGLAPGVWKDCRDALEPLQTIHLDI